MLEHVAWDERHALLDELARVSARFVLLAAPFSTAGVADADQLLFATIIIPTILMVLLMAWPFIDTGRDREL